MAPPQQEVARQTIAIVDTREREPAVEYAAIVVGERSTVKYQTAARRHEAFGSPTTQTEVRVLLWRLEGMR
jgi:hypothetical protein